VKLLYTQKMHLFRVPFAGLYTIEDLHRNMKDCSKGIYKKKAICFYT